MFYKIITRTTTLLFLIAASFIFIQCDNRTDDRSSAFDQERSELTSNLEDLRDDIDDRIDNLESRIEDNNNDEVENNLEAQRDELRDDRSSVDRAIDDLENSTEDSWETFQTESENLYIRISTKLDEWSDSAQDRSDDY